LTSRLCWSTRTSGAPASSPSSAAVATSRGWDFLDLEGGDQVGVDEADVDADELDPLLLQLHAGGVRLGPDGRLGGRVGREVRRRQPGDDRKHVDEGAAAVGGDHRGEGLLGGGADARRRAIAVVSSMVGALLMARAVGDEDLSEEILAAARENVASA
jgi:hypothetical protein